MSTNETTQWERSVVYKARNLTSIPTEHQAMVGDELFTNCPYLLHIYQINENASLNTHMKYLLFLLLSILTLTFLNCVDKTAHIQSASSTLALVLRRGTHEHHEF